MNAQKPDNEQSHLPSSARKADGELQSIDLYVDEQRWATLSRDSDGVSLHVAQCRDGQPWRIGADSLKHTLESARKLLGA